MQVTLATAILTFRVMACFEIEFSNQLELLTAPIFSEHDIFKSACKHLIKPKFNADDAIGIITVEAD